MLRELRLSPLMIAGLCALAALDCGAAWFAARAFLPPPPSDVAVKSDWRAPSDIDASTPFAEQPPKDEETLARPVFSQTRRPAPRRKEAAAGAAGLPAGMNLRGVIKMGRLKSAFLVWDGEAEGKWVSQGETIENWLVSDIGDIDATLTKAETSLQLLLDYQGEGAAPQPPRRSPLAPGRPGSAGAGRSG